MPFAQVDISTQEVTYLHTDLIGSVVAKTGSSDTLIGKTDYSPYGETTGSALSRFGYAGEWTDETTGYSFLRARWLDVRTGSFLSEDPLVQMTQNSFGYTEGNPLTQVDPLGLWSGDEMKNWFNDTGEKLDKWSRQDESVEMISNASTTFAGVAGGFALASLNPTAAVVTAPLAAVFGGVSFALQVTSTLLTCRNKGLNDDSCLWGLGGSLASIVPMLPFAGKLGSYAIRNIPKHADTITTGVIMTKKLSSQLLHGALQLSGLALDGVSRYKTSCKQ